MDDIDFRKFRVYDLDRREYLDSKSIVMTPDGEILTIGFADPDSSAVVFDPLEGNYVIEFATGCRDSNGALIYDGDVCSCDPGVAMDEVVVVKAKFTPGPWKVGNNYNCTVITTRKDLPPNRTWGHGCEADFVCSLEDGEYDNYLNPEERCANAHLIAAAPEMYGMLKSLLTGARELLTNAAATKIERILKKARGEE